MATIMIIIFFVGIMALIFASTYYILRKAHNKKHTSQPQYQQSPMAQPIPQAKEEPTKQIQQRYCSNCGKQIIGDYSFCPYCGERITEPLKDNPPTGSTPKENG
jgi:hypothetical protein